MNKGHDFSGLGQCVGSNIHIPADNKPLIYVACPYTYINNSPIGIKPKSENEIEEIHKHRYQVVSRIAGKLLLVGNLVYSPISHSYPMKVCANLPDKFEFYRELDEFYLARSDILAVVTMEGWEESKGVQHEISYMHDLGKPVIYLPEEL